MPKALRQFPQWLRARDYRRILSAPINNINRFKSDMNEKNQTFKAHPKRQWDETQREVNFRGQKKKSKTIKKSGVDDVLLHDVLSLLKAQKLEDDNKLLSLPKPFTEIEVMVKEISSTGDGLAIHSESKRIYVVPFCVPGDVIKAKVIKHYKEENYSTADFVSVITPGPLRDDSRIKCKYFGTCSGCQFQMLDYDAQLEHKKKVIERAYKNFSKLPQHLIPFIGDTIGSPLPYEYRTKLTPHFNAPKGYISKADKMKGVKNHFQETPSIGFNAKGANYTLDIEDCPIGTSAVRMGMKRERLRVAENLDKYTKGATILLRESTLRLPNNETNLATNMPDTIKTVDSDFIDFKSCVTDNRAKTTEYVDKYVFTNIANEFFQNNNSILPRFTSYIREHILPQATTGKKIKYLIDAYSGSGLFTITLSSIFESSLGIDISAASINSAEENARQNNLAPSRARFMAADASQLFKEIDFNPDETVVLIDPSRKGCDESFISQLLKYAPRRIVYVSCNVHTQARDVGMIINGLAALGDIKGSDTQYTLESIVGFDFFPQTGHVESVAILDRVRSQESNSAEFLDICKKNDAISESKNSPPL
ncbi:tRNA -methyltransferase [Golovinomyces cichoracearum]|uniref:tRNA-methyltransferase n=1 Tax=Golovinomyces cichoracearum TaxID=62708 RepID=A0A420HG54_9PEZI|nr:tRNA -methyltransferase [Golovinomyces cichoracearum]